jgi:hypothetical protein
MSDPISRNAPCPCGSGRKYKQCCLGKSRDEKGRRRGIKFGVIAGAVLVAVIAMFAWTQYRPKPATGPVSPTTPAPWEYDVRNNRHWHPGHGHWHDGPPPVTAPSSTGGATPQPYEYDAVNDRHWDPDHGHWHSGPPPGRGAGVRTETPQPYEYDAVNNRHWDPDHGHWHDGPPPTISESIGPAPSP